MTWQYETVDQWINDCRATVRQDRDNLLLFTGPEGEGKSTVAVKVMSALDPDFSEDRIHFGIRPFLSHAASTPRYGAVLGDEIEANKRRGMHGPNLDLLDFLKDCRALNLHIGFCFPHEAQFDEAILNHRVRWKVHVPQRGTFIVSERQQIERRQRRTGRTMVHYVWVERGRWTFGPNKGKLWDAYHDRKEAHMRSLGDRYKQDGADASSGGDLDFEDARAFFAGWVNEHHGRPRVS